MPGAGSAVPQRSVFRRHRSRNSTGFAPTTVWTDEQASYLVDTVLSELPFPEIYLRSRTDAKGKTQHEVVDGQQRIRSLLAFAANDLTLEGPEVTSPLAGKSFEDLSKKQKERFWDYSVVVRDLGSASNSEIRDLFRRLNKHSVVLNTQELRHARFKGVFIQLMEELSDDPWWIDVRLVTPKQVRRMEDIEFVSELFVGIMAGPQNKKEGIDEYYESYERDFPDKAKYAKKFRDTRALLCDTLVATDLVDWSGKSDFYSLFLSFSKFSEASWTADQKKHVSEDLGKLREAIDEAKKKDATEIRNRTVRTYVQAVTRAASDIDRRKARIEIITNLIRNTA